MDGGDGRWGQPISTWIRRGLCMLGRPSSQPGQHGWTRIPAIRWIGPVDRGLPHRGDSVVAQRESGGGPQTSPKAPKAPSAAAGAGIIRVHCGVFVYLTVREAHGGGGQTLIWAARAGPAVAYGERLRISLGASARQCTVMTGSAGDGRCGWGLCLWTPAFSRAQLRNHPG